MAGSVTSHGTAAQRQARRRAALAGQGVGQINLTAPSEAHAALKEIARRTKAGEPVSFVLDSVATKARLAGKPMDTAKLGKVLADMPAPEPGFVLAAIKLTNAASGNDQRKFKRLAGGLAWAGGANTGRGGAYVGSLPEAAMDAVRALVETCGGRMEIRG